MATGGAAEHTVVRDRDPAPRPQELPLCSDEDVEWSRKHQMLSWGGVFACSAAGMRTSTSEVEGRTTVVGPLQGRGRAPASSGGSLRILGFLVS